MDKLIVVIMGPGRKSFGKMCIDSIKEADKIYYYTSEKNLDKMQTFTNLEHVFFTNNSWDNKDKATNGKCRNEYLDMLKDRHSNDWCLILDEDEILDEGGIEKIKSFINNKDRQPGLYNVKMRHFIGDLGHEDATKQVHIVPCRLFKISEAIKYPLHSHPVLEGELKGACLDTTIWHLGHLPIEYMDYILKRYKQHMNDSIYHPKEFLHNWKINHLFGIYPQKQINPMELPKQICDRYEIDKDYFYFMNRGIELKHSEMVKRWHDYFKPNSVLDLGCGRGCYLYFWKWFVNEVKGIEISNWAKENSFVNKDDILIGDVTLIDQIFDFDLVTAIDLLEHIKYEELDHVLQMMNKTGNKFLFSIPFEGDPNLEADPTHIIKESKDWWITKLGEYFNIKEAPKDWLFAHQILIGEKK